MTPMEESFPDPGLPQEGPGLITPMEVVMDIASFLVALLASGLVTSALTGKIKNFIKAQDLWAVLTTAVVSVVISVVQMLVQGNLDFSTLSVEHILETAPAVFSGAVVVYRVFRAWADKTPGGKGNFVTKLFVTPKS